MFPTELELKQHFDELRAASEQFKLAQSLREKPTLWERLFTRLSMNSSAEARAVSMARLFASKDQEAFNQTVCRVSTAQ